MIAIGAIPAASAAVPAAIGAEAAARGVDAAQPPTSMIIVGDGDASTAQLPADTAAATSAAPAQAGGMPTTALVGQQATPMQIGAHAPQSPGLGGAFIALLLVLGLILGLAWLLKRLPGGGFRQADGLRVVASIPLGAKERAAVVQVGAEQLLLGIGPGGVRTLHVLPQRLSEPDPVQMPSLKTLPDFKQLLAQRLRKAS